MTLNQKSQHGLSNIDTENVVLVFLCMSLFTSQHKNSQSFE